MKKQSEHKIYAVIFFTSILYSLTIALLSDLSWPIGDEKVYEELALGGTGHGNFSYRYIAPFIVGLFQKSLHKWIWLALTIISLALICVLLYIFLRNKNYHKNICIYGVLFFIGSKVYFYHVFTFGLVDPLFFVFLMIVLINFEKGNYILTAVSIGLSFYIKEAIILFIPLLILNSIIKKQKIMAIILIIEMLIFGLKTYLRGIASFTMNQLYIEMTYHNIDIHNGIAQALFAFIKLVGIHYTLYLYGLIIFIAIIGFIKIDWKEKFIIIILIGEILLLFAQVADWDRMMFLLFPFIIDLAMRVLTQVKNPVYTPNKIFDYLAGFIVFLWICASLMVSGSNLRYLLSVIGILGITLLVLYMNEMRRNGLSYKKIFLSKFEN